MAKKKTTHKDPFNVQLEPEEQEIEMALPKVKGKLPVTKNLAEEILLAKKASANYLRKDTKINIRLSGHDVECLRRIAAKEGLPYQTLISSILHKYAASHL
jgi:predicted DNA binding CopG/RHH family protein